VFARPLAAVVALFGGLALAGAFARRERGRTWRRHAEAEAPPAPPRARERAAASEDGELGAILASLADGIRDPLRAAQGLVRQMGEDPESSRNVDCARLALREIDRLERNVSRLLAEAREAARRRGSAEVRA
jgi:signal transduction histidine kinase